MTSQMWQVDLLLEGRMMLRIAEIDMLRLITGELLLVLATLM